MLPEASAPHRPDVLSFQPEVVPSSKSVTIWPKQKYGRNEISKITLFMQRDERKKVNFDRF
jgi:hypothetical protein